MGDLEVKLKYKKDECDDWTKVEDKTLRKKIQNRLAKRKNRDDAKKNKRRTEPEIESVSPPTMEEANQSPPKTPIGQSDEDELQMAAFGKPFSVRKLFSESTDFYVHLKAYLALPGLVEHRYLQLSQFSLLRAFIRNAELLGIDPFLFEQDDAVSPWTVSHTYSIPGPNTLSPTPIQLCTPHHPYLDVIAIPSMRDNMIIAALSNEQEDEVCNDMHTDSFTVWGSQPWNAMAWEVSQTFVDKWWWLLGDEAFTHSNFWRAERGEAPLLIPEVDLGAVIGELS